MEELRGGSQDTATDHSTGVISGELSVDLVQDQLGRIHSTQLSHPTELKIQVVSTTAVVTLQLEVRDFSRDQLEVLTDITELHHLRTDLYVSSRAAALETVGVRDGPEEVSLVVPGHALHRPGLGLLQEAVESEVRPLGLRDDPCRGPPEADQQGLCAGERKQKTQDKNIHFVSHFHFCLVCLQRTLLLRKQKNK